MTAFEAHLKLLAILPSKVHEWTPSDSHKAGRAVIERTRWLIAEIARLRGAGYSRAEIMKETGCSVATIWRHIKAFDNSRIKAHIEKLSR